MRKQGELSVSSAAILGRVRARWKRGFLSPAADTAIAASAPDVAAMLLDYLDARLGVRNLAFIEKPAAFTDGWETYNYHFQLQSRDRLPAKFAQPLAVRIYCGPTALPRAKREFLVHRHLYQVNYPVAEPLFLEENCTYFD